MAKTKMARRRVQYRTRTVTRRSGPSSKVVRQRVSAAAKRARTSAEKREVEGDMYAVGAALLLGLAARKNIELPAIGEIGTAGTVGAGMYLAGAYLKGATGRKMKAASVGPLSVAAHELAEDSDLFDWVDNL